MEHYGIRDGEIKGCAKRRGNVSRAHHKRLWCSIDDSSRAERKSIVDFLWRIARTLPDENHETVPSAEVREEESHGSGLKPSAESSVDCKSGARVRAPEEWHPR